MCSHLVVGFIHPSPIYHIPSPEHSTNRGNELDRRESNFKAVSGFSNIIDDIEVRERQPSEGECEL
jgi:hypothetical protein